MSTAGARAGLLTNVATAALPLVGSFLVSLLLAPYVGDAGFGLYSLVMSAATFLLIVAKFGVHAATSRLVSEHESAPGPWIRAGLAIRLPLTLAVAVVAVAAAPWFSQWLAAGEDARTAFRWAGAVIVGASVFEFGTDLMVGLRAFRAQFAMRLAALVLRIAALVAVRATGVGLEWFLAGHALAQFLPASAVLLQRLAATRGQTSPPGVRPIRRTWDVAVPLAFSSASFLIYAHTDRLMLGVFHDAATVGQFAVARNVIDAALFPVVALAWSLRPALVRARRDPSRATSRAVLADGLRLSIVYAAIGAALLPILGPRLVEGIFTSQYAEAGTLLVWMVPLLVVRGLGTVIFPALIAADAQGRYARLMAWTAGVNAVANLILIPALGAVGAVLSTLLALGVLTVGGLRDVARLDGGLPAAELRGPALRAVASAAVAAPLVWAATRVSSALWFTAGVAVLGAAVLLIVNVGPGGRGLRIGSGDVDDA